MDPDEARRVFGDTIERDYRAADLLKRPGVSYAGLCSLRTHDGSTIYTAGDVPVDVAEQVEIEAKYAGYVDRQRDEVTRSTSHERTPIPVDVDYSSVRGLSFEARQKLSRHRPTTLGEASRLAGVTPATISLLMVHLKRGLGRVTRDTAVVAMAGVD